jgi:hypothetical protein
MTGKTLCGFVVAAVLGIGFAGIGRAAPITWEFEGRLEVIDAGGTPPNSLADFMDALDAHGIRVGAAVHGRMTFESSTPDSRPDPAYGRYTSAINFFEVFIGDYAMRSDLFRGMPTSNRGDIFAASLPEVGASGFFARSSGGDTVGLVTIQGLMALELSSHDAASFAPAAIALPIDPPNLADIDPFGFDPGAAFGYGTSFIASISNELGRGQMHTALTRLERVPEPGVVALFAPGLLALVALRLRAS